MVTEKRQQIQSSTTYTVPPPTKPATTKTGRTIEETYQKKTQLEHILLRPDTYIGSIEKHEQTLWVWEEDQMVKRSISYVPGLYKIFDEILVNAVDNKQRDPKMDSVKVTIDVQENLISVYNNGDGIPVEIHQEEGVYVPEMIFGHLLTSSNYDDSIKKTTGGRYGFGAKLTNIFSTEFTLETADGKRNRRYKQVFSNNMEKKSEPTITECKSGENWTMVSFRPDLSKFGMECLEADVVALMKKRVVDIAGCLGKSVRVELDGNHVPLETFEDYVKLYLKSSQERMYEKVNKRWEICVSMADGHFEQVSFVNNIATIKGGTHVDYITNQIANHLVAVVKKQNKHANLKAHNVKKYLWVFVNALIDNPAFDSQTKETLTIKQSSFGSTCELTPDFLHKVAKWVQKANGNKRGKLNIPELGEANFAATNNSDNCTLILTEGDTSMALGARTYFNSRHKGLRYSVDDVQSIPSMVDGLTPCQRKILFCAFKKPIFEEVNVARFSDYVNQHYAYPLFGEASLVDTIIGMAQNFVGSNNINLLYPSGHFGSRIMGGKDHAKGEYIYTKLTPITRHLFHKADELLLNYWNVGGGVIEPTWYLPIIPMVLVNGSEGIGNWWSTFVPKYNPRDIIANLRRLLNNEPMVCMDPWYKGFKGTIQKSSSGYISTCNVEVEESDDKFSLSITELPVGWSTQDYKEFLNAASLSGKDKEPFIEKYYDRNGYATVHFEVIMTADQMYKAFQEGLLKKFKLTTELDTSYMHLFADDGVIKKYETPEQIIEDFFHLRLHYYEKRKTVLLHELYEALLTLENKVTRFNIELAERKNFESIGGIKDICDGLKVRGYTSLPDAVPEASIAGAVDHVAGGKDMMGYDYSLLKLLEEWELKRAEYVELACTPSRTLWLRDLDALDKLIYEQYERYAKDAERLEAAIASALEKMLPAEAQMELLKPEKKEQGKRDAKVAERLKMLTAAKRAAQMELELLKPEKKVRKLLKPEQSEEEEDDAIEAEFDDDEQNGKKMMHVCSDSSEDDDAFDEKQNRKTMYMSSDPSEEEDNHRFDDEHNRMNMMQVLSDSSEEDDDEDFEFDDEDEYL